MWLARDKDETLHIFVSKPERKYCEFWYDGYNNTTVEEKDLIDFDSLSWEDDPIEVLPIEYWTTQRVGQIFMTIKVFKYKIYERRK